VLQRVITAIVLLGIVLGALFLDRTGVAAFVLICAIGILAAKELFELIDLPWWKGLLFSFPLTCLLTHFAPTSIALAPLFLLSAYFQIKQRYASIAAIVWISSGVSALLSLMLYDIESTFPVVLVVAIPIWFGDTFALLVGKYFGKHKIAPSISPKKTWEGSIANAIACVGAGYLIPRFTDVNGSFSVTIAYIAAIAGQAGDLLESWIKRNAGVKDSGTLLPGHGGVLDRIDSLLATAPFALFVIELSKELPKYPWKHH
jgi:phosphatidate cytidylyltransferase